MVNWDDNHVFVFLMEFSVNSDKTERKCAAAAQRLVYAEASASEFVPQHCRVFEKRKEMYARRYRMGKPIGTLWCRRTKEGKWFIKDGNHRFAALKDRGELIRFAYDPEGAV